MATLAVETTKRLLYLNGPSILRTTYVDHDQNGKAVTLPRLQGPGGPHKTSETDPHKQGRALDIILFASKDNERVYADALVEMFLDLRTEMNWSAVIYNNWEWYKDGTKHVRGGDAINRHVTHIHIEWRAADAVSSHFEDVLAEGLTSRSWVLDPGF